MRPRAPTPAPAKVVVAAVACWLVIMCGAVALVIWADAAGLTTASRHEACAETCSPRAPKRIGGECYCDWRFLKP